MCSVKLLGLCYIGYCIRCKTGTCSFIVGVTLSVVFCLVSHTSSRVVIVFRSNLSLAFLIKIILLRQLLTQGTMKKFSLAVGPQNDLFNCAYH